jgi:hypothetical protein
VRVQAHEVSHTDVGVGFWALGAAWLIHDGCIYRSDVHACALGPSVTVDSKNLVAVAGPFDTFAETVAALMQCARRDA